MSGVVLERRQSEEDEHSVQQENHAHHDERESELADAEEGTSDSGTGDVTDSVEDLQGGLHVRGRSLEFRIGDAVRIARLLLTKVVATFSGKTAAVIANAEVTAADDPSASTALTTNDSVMNIMRSLIRSSNLSDGKKQTSASPFFGGPNGGGGHSPETYGANRGNDYSGIQQRFRSEEVDLKKREMSRILPATRKAPQRTYVVPENGTADERHQFVNAENEAVLLRRGILRFRLERNNSFARVRASVSSSIVFQLTSFGKKGACNDTQMDSAK